MKGLTISHVFIGFVLGFATLVFVIPFLANAGSANAECNPVIQECFCGMKKDPKTQQCTMPGNKFMCPCKETVNGGTVMGKCLASNFCHGESHSGGAGQSGGGLGMEQLMQALQGIMGALKGGGGGGGGGSGSGSGSGAGDYGAGSQGCTTYTQTSDPNNADPCAYYVPGAFSSSTSVSGAAGSTGGSGNITLPNGSTVQAGCTTYHETSVPNNPDPCTYYVPPATSSGSGSGSGTSGAGSGSGTSDECTSYTQTSDPNSSDPCTFYVPSVGGSGASAVSGGTGVGPTSAGGNADGGGNAFSNAISSIGNENEGGSANANDNDINNQNENDVAVSVTGEDGNIFQTFFDRIAGLRGGASGNIDLSDKGATIYAGGHNPNDNSSAAGFYGTDTFGSQPQGLVARLCFNRPWANTFFSTIIPPAFFDNLCKWRGYELASDAMGDDDAVVRLQTILLKGGQPSQPQQASTTGAVQAYPVYPPPEVHIWASPKAVPIGGRTSIFWYSRNAVSCLVTSSDGSFHETALADGASTVPISDATLFTITCKGRSDQSATETVLVTIKI